MDDNQLKNSSHSWTGGTQKLQGINENGAVNAAILGKASLRYEQERPVDLLHIFRYVQLCSSKSLISLNMGNSKNIAILIKYLKKVLIFRLHAQVSNSATDHAFPGPGCASMLWMLSIHHHAAHWRC